MLDQLPLSTGLLMNLDAELDDAVEVGNRRIVYATGGSFEGPRVRGRVLPGGGTGFRSSQTDRSPWTSAPFWRLTMEN